MSEPAADQHTVTIILMGRDRPGVTAEMFRTLSPFGVDVLDIEQIVLRGRLVLGILLTAPRELGKLREAAERAAAGLGMDIEVVTGEGDIDRYPSGRAHVTLLGHPLTPRAVAAITGRIADTGAN